MNYGISLRDRPSKIISDYVYSIYSKRVDFDDALYYLMQLVEQYQWIKAIEPRIIHPDHISFVTQDYKKNRIIINLASSVSFHGNETSKTSDFIYLNCATSEDFNERLNNIREQLEELVL